MNSISRTLAVSIAIFHFADVAHAAEATQLPVPDRMGWNYIHFSAGSFSPDSNAQLPNANGHYGLALGFGSRYSRHVAWEVEFFNSDQAVDTPSIPIGFFTVLDQRADISTVGLAGNVRFIYPLGRFEPYVGGGIGFYRTEMEISGSTFGLPGSLKKNDNGFGLQLLAGMEYYFGQRTQHSLGVQYRTLSLDADFGPEVAGKVNVGGDFWFLTYRRSF